MKRFMLSALFFISTAFLLPLFVFLIMNFKDGLPKSENERKDDTISVYFHKENKTYNMGLEEYLVGVVRAEMPASFHEEALKAQAVAARSYALYKMLSKSSDSVHPDSSVCTDHTHCKAYKTEEEAFLGWGKDSEKYNLKIISAVNSTKGEILTYDGEVALAVFHAQTGGGKTESSSDVWGGKLPYLVSVESRDENNAPDFYSSLDISFEDFKKKLASENPLVKINSPKDIKPPVKSEGGGVKEITIGGVSFKGSKIRSIFSLRSSCFTITADNSNVHFEVSGYGHGVGMSQYGANTMALEGFGYKDILMHYYSGTVIEYV